MEESLASKFCTKMRDQSSCKVGPIAKTTTWWSLFPSVTKTPKQDSQPAVTQGKLPALVQAINSAKSASTSDTSVNSWASKRRSQTTTN